MRKDTALKRIDLARRIIESLDSGASVLSVDLQTAFDGDVRVHVSDVAPPTTEYTLTHIDSRYEHRFYPVLSEDGITAGYTILIPIPSENDSQENDSWPI